MALYLQRPPRREEKSPIRTSLLSGQLLHERIQDSLWFCSYWPRAGGNPKTGREWELGPSKAGLIQPKIKNVGEQRRWTTSVRLQQKTMTGDFHLHSMLASRPIFRQLSASTLRWSCSLMIVDRLSRPLVSWSPERAPLVIRVRFVGEVLLFLGLANHSAQITTQIIFIDLVISGVIRVQIVRAARLEQG